MHDGDPMSIQTVRDACPRCRALSGTPNLLTSMTRYYVCGHCACRWNVSRTSDTDDRLMHDRTDPVADLGEGEL
jgi:hypothetical protein